MVCAWDKGPSVRPVGYLGAEPLPLPLSLPCRLNEEASVVSRLWLPRLAAAREKRGKNERKRGRGQTSPATEVWSHAPTFRPHPLESCWLTLASGDVSVCLRCTNILSTLCILMSIWTLCIIVYFNYCSFLTDRLKKCRILLFLKFATAFTAQIYALILQVSRASAGSHSGGHSVCYDFCQCGE